MGKEGEMEVVSTGAQSRPRDPWAQTKRRATSFVSILAPTVDWAHLFSLVLHPTRREKGKTKHALRSLFLSFCSFF